MGWKDEISIRMLDTTPVDHNYKIDDLRGFMTSTMYSVMVDEIWARAWHISILICKLFYSYLQSSVGEHMQKSSEFRK